MERRACAYGEEGVCIWREGCVCMERRACAYVEEGVCV